MSELAIARITPQGRRRGPLRRLLDLFSSVWLGITLLVLIFIYSSIGSALPPVRQHWLVEKTEFEFFHWWPFDLLILLLVANLLVVTFRRIAFNRFNLGVWMIHTGIVILALGSVYYFGTKVEGDTPIFRRRVAIRLPGQSHALHLLARPGNRAVAGTGADRHEFEIVDIQPDYALRSEGHEGERTYAVQVAVRSTTKKYIRQLLAGYPEFTEDVIPGQGRAVKAIGKPLVDEELDITLELEQQRCFYIQDTAALYVRPDDSDTWTPRPINGLPHYHERFASREDVWLPPDQPMPVRPIDLAVPAAGHGDPLAEYQVHVTGYLRYAIEESRWVPGGDRLNPVCGLRIRGSGPTTHEYTLAAFDPASSTAEGGAFAFRWIESLDELESLTSGSPTALSVHVPEQGVRLELSADELVRRMESDEFQPIEGTDYAFRVRNVINHLTVPSGHLEGRTVSVVVVEIRKGDVAYTRWVCDVPEATRDLGADSHEAVTTDSGIKMTYEPGDAWQVMVAAGPGEVGAYILVNNPRGRLQRHAVTPGQAVPISQGFEAELAHLYPQAKRERRPAIVPLAERDRDAGKAFSMIKVEVSKGSWSESAWLPYNHYALADPQYGIPGRIAYQPETIRLPDGRRVQLMYSRRRQELPAPVALDTFQLVTFAGGLIGSNTNVRDYVSRLRFQQPDGTWSEPMQMSSNQPAQNGGMWFFQATWDPPTGESAGMNYTGAGVGNRNGVHVQLAGCCVAVAGMIYAFYVKPILKRRRRQVGEQHLASAAAAGEAAGRPLEPAGVS